LQRIQEEADMNKLLLATAVAFGLASGASAGTLPVDWEFNSDADWTNVDTRYFTKFSQDTLSWGSNCLFRICGPSTLSFDDTTPGSESGTLPMGASGHVEILSIDWENASTLGWFTPNTLLATADIDLDWTLPSPGNFASTGLTVDIFNTLNPDGDDIALTLALGDFGAPFRIGDLLVEGYSLVHTGAGSFDGTNWFNPEGGNSSLVLKANVAAVPLPAAGWMLLAGVGGLAALRRRRQKS
jgi:hypothetical protein